MKSRIPLNLSRDQRKALEEEVKRQCVESTEKYELDLDTVYIWILRTKCKYGVKKITEIYNAMFEERLKLQEYYKSERNDNIAEFAMRYHLKQDGIDVEEMYKENKNHRFEVVVK